MPPATDYPQEWGEYMNLKRMPFGVFRPSEDPDYARMIPTHFRLVINTWNLEVFDDFFGLGRDIPAFAYINREQFIPKRYYLGVMERLVQLAQHPLKPSLCKIRTAISCQLVKNASCRDNKITIAHLQAVLDDFKVELKQLNESLTAKNIGESANESDNTDTDADESDGSQSEPEVSDYMKNPFCKGGESLEVVDDQEDCSINRDALASNPRHCPPVPTGSLDSTQSAMVVNHQQRQDRPEEERAPKRPCTDLTAMRLKRLVKESELNLAQYELTQAKKERKDHFRSLISPVLNFGNDITQIMEKHQLILTEGFSQFAGYDVHERISYLVKDCQKYLASQAEKDKDFIEISNRTVECARFVNELKSQLLDLDNCIGKNKEHGAGE